MLCSECRIDEWMEGRPSAITSSSVIERGVEGGATASFNAEKGAVSETKFEPPISWLKSYNDVEDGMGVRGRAGGLKSVRAILCSRNGKHVCNSTTTGRTC